MKNTTFIDYAELIKCMAEQNSTFHNADIVILPNLEDLELKFPGSVDKLLPILLNNLEKGGGIKFIPNFEEVSVYDNQQYIMLLLKNK